MRKWKRQLAWLMAVSMLAGNSLTSYADVEAGIGVQLDQTSNDEASGAAAEIGGSAGEATDGEQSESESTVEIATPSETEKEETDSGDQTATESEPDTSMYEVTWEVYPEGTAEVSAKEEIRAGKTLKFKVKPEKGWEIESVFVNNEEVEPVEPFLGITFGTSKRYEIEDVHFDQQIEVNMKEEAEEEPVVLTAEDGGMSVTLSEIDEGALADVASIEAVRLENDADVEAAVQEQLGEKQLADYAALDIKLYDKDGNEVEPAGEVSVTFGGVETEAEYDSVEVYHLTESDTASAKKPARAPMKPSVMAADEETENADEAGAVSVYDAEKVTKGVEEKIADKGEITFTAKKFSPYVIVFVDSEKNFRINFELRGLYSQEEIDADPSKQNKGSELENSALTEPLVLSADKKVDLQSIVFKNNMAEFYPTKIDGVVPAEQVVYTYSYATFEDESNAEQKTELTKEDVTGETPVKTVYLWYTKISDIRLTANVHFVDGSSQDREDIVYVEDVPLGAGNFYTDKDHTVPSDLLKDVLSEQKVIDATENYELDHAAFAQAQLKPAGSAADDWSEEIVSVSRNGSNYYARTRSGQVVSVDTENGTKFDIHLFFVSGFKVKVTAKTNDPTAVGNKVNGKTITSASEEVIFEDNMYNTKSFNIPIEIQQGYDVVITRGGEVIYNSKTFDTPQRSTYISGTVNSAQLLYEVSFEKSELTLDYNKVYQLNWDNGAFHQVSMWVDDEQILKSNEYGNTIQAPAEVSSEFVLKLQTLPKQNAYSHYSFRMDSLSINGFSIQVPNLNNLTEIGNKDTVGSDQTEDGWQYIYDQSGDEAEPIAVIKSITAEVKGEDSGWNKENSAYVVYEIHFSDVKSWLKITGGNMKNIDFTEVVFRSVNPSGTADVIVGSDVLKIGDQKRFESSRDSYEFHYRPVGGYYIKSAEVIGAKIGDNATELSTPWYNERTQTIKNSTTKYRTLDVYTEAIKYRGSCTNLVGFDISCISPAA